MSLSTSVLLFGKVDEEEAARTYKLLAEMDQLAELEVPEA